MNQNRHDFRVFFLGNERFGSAQSPNQKKELEFSHPDEARKQQKHLQVGPFRE